MGRCPMRHRDKIAASAQITVCRRCTGSAEKTISSDIRTYPSSSRNAYAPFPVPAPDGILNPSHKAASAPSKISRRKISAMRSYAGASVPASVSGRTVGWMKCVSPGRSNKNTPGSMRYGIFSTIIVPVPDRK